VEAEDGTVVELSLKALQDGGHRLSDVAWKDLLEDYQLFTCRAPPREASRRARSARGAGGRLGGADGRAAREPTRRGRWQRPCEWPILPCEAIPFKSSVRLRVR
jgi:hypothetical protein